MLSIQNILKKHLNTLVKMMSRSLIQSFYVSLNIFSPIFARVIHNYMRWRLVQTFIEDLSYKYVHEHRIFLEKYVGYAIHTSNEDYCTREVIRKFPLAIHRLYTRNVTSYSDATQTVSHNRRIDNTLDIFVDRLKQWSTR